MSDAMFHVDCAGVVPWSATGDDTLDAADFQVDFRPTYAGLAIDATRVALPRSVTVNGGETAHLGLPDGWSPGWGWQVRVRGANLSQQTWTDFELPEAGETVALSQLVTQVVPSPSFTAERAYTRSEVDALLAALPGTGGGGGAVTADDTPAAPAEGQSASYLVSSAVVWPAGLIWSTDPDGGTAPTITGSALVSLFTVGGVTRAIMGATFPAVVVPDTTAPAWSATLTTGTPTSTSVVIAASSLATDAVGVTAYERSLNSGSTWAAIVPSGLNFTLTGLTAATAYPAPQLRAKDAAGNISPVLTAQAFTTAAAGDTTAPTVGTMAASSVTSSGFTLTVSGASDETALHATPYAYSTNNGTTWSTWQAGATYNATGLAASTGYQARHKVRDAAGNESTGTAVTVTTTAIPTSGTAFTDFTTGTGLPTGFTDRWNLTTIWEVADDATASGGKYLKATRPDNGRTFASWDVIQPDATTVELVTRLRWPVGSAGGHPLRLRASGGVGSENGYFALVDAAGADTISKYVAGSPTTLGPPFELPTTNGWCWIRLRVEGTTISLRYWDDVDAEPGTWNETRTDTSLAGGMAGIGAFLAGQTHFDLLGAAWGGGTAPKTA